MNLFVGRFQGLTLSHCRMIEKSDIIVIVDSGKISLRNPFPYDIREEMIGRVFSDDKRIIKAQNGYIPDIIHNNNLNHVDTIVCGSDRVMTYMGQFAITPMWFNVYPRHSQISGSMFREALLKDDKQTFEKITHHKIHDMYDELRKLLVQTLK